MTSNTLVAMWKRGHKRAPNGMNLSRSIHNPNSRAIKIIRYLRQHGPSTREDIARNALGLGLRPYNRGWGSFIFSLLVGHGMIRKVRIGNRVTYELTKEMQR